MGSTILEFKNVSYAYDDQPPAIENISLTIMENQRIAVIGNNGAGKSTFFLCCNGVLEAQLGELYLEGKKIKYSRKDLNELRQRVGMVFQDPNQQFIGTSVEDDISFGPINLGLDNDQVKIRVTEALSAMSLTQLKKRPPHYLSGGEKKRLSIADIIAMHPDIILFDEPTASLDYLNLILLEKSLEQLYRLGKTLVISTHDIDFANRWADRVLLFHKGKLIADDTPEAIFSHQDLLDYAGIHPPQLYSVAKMLKEKGFLQNTNIYPKTLEELSKLI